MSFDELPFEDLLQSVLRGAVWEEQLVAGAPAGAAGGAAAAGGALAHQAVSRSGGLRCLDASHAADCELCLPPPVVGEEGAGCDACDRLGRRTCLPQKGLSACASSAARAPR